MRGNLSSKVLLFTLAAGFMAMAPRPPVEASTLYLPLCGSLPSMCEYTGPEAPVLKADVCWDRANDVVLLKGTSACAGGTFPYFVEFGEVVEPLTGAVQAYVPLPDACDYGYCVGYAPVDPGVPEPLCCTSSAGTSCVPNPQDSKCQQTLVYCEESSSNGDGTLTCHLQEE